MIPYVADPFVGRRRLTRVVAVGDVRIGGEHPIRVQSMTTTDTRDTQGTVDQAERLAAVGCEIVRITAPSITDAENLRAIRDELRRRGVSVPLVADIHFTPNAAMIAAEIVEKVRVNPGNYADKKKFAVLEYSDAEYAAELERVGERFRPLVRRLKERGAALRIGTNHGSLSDRIMNRYGDTPRGMVESALEFLDVCEDEDYYDVVFSMKASNAQVAVQAYRLLAARLEERAPGQPGYPFHVGVTEAGDAEDGRIKSAIGIGALLEDGIGDTIRVSLTEDPVKEIPVAQALARRAESRLAPTGEDEDQDERARDSRVSAEAPFSQDPYAHRRRPTDRLPLPGELGIGGDDPVRVEVDLGAVPEDVSSCAAAVSTSFALQGELACEGLRVEAASAQELARVDELVSELASLGIDAPVVVAVPLSLAADATATAGARVALPVAGSDLEGLCDAAGVVARAGKPLELCLDGVPASLSAQVEMALAALSAGGVKNALLCLASPRATHAARLVAALLADHGAERMPLLLRYRGTDADALLDSAVDLGAPLCDGIGDAVCVPAAAFGSAGTALDIAYRILQGARLRTTRTEYISCPSCGRTLFDLEETTARIKQDTSHLKGVKIAVMGCIVNGPGEMADADFGYVGSGVGQVTLYVGKEIVARSVPEATAPARLVELIREEGMWREPPESPSKELEEPC
jgi:(E)-4-hydroxy-3-methylbut-2-enyl-diphosphate synthase